MYKENSKGKKTQHFLATPTKPLKLSSSESSNLAFLIHCPSYAALFQLSWEHCYTNYVMILVPADEYAANSLGVLSGVYPTSYLKVNRPLKVVLEVRMQRNGTPCKGALQ